MIWTRIILVVASLVPPTVIKADPVTAGFAVRRFGVEEGLPQASVSAILESRDGYLWVGTFGGLARFDGRSFTPVPAAGPRVPPLARVLALHEGPRGRIWVSAEGEGILAVEGNHLVRPRGFPDLGVESVNAILEEPNGRIWLGTSFRGLVLIENGAIKQTWVPERSVTDLEARPGGGVWAASPQEILEVPGPGAGRSLLRVPGKDFLRLLRTPDGRLLVSEVSGGLYLITDGHMETLHEDSQDIHYTTLARSPSNEIWASLAGKGVARVQGSDMEVITIPAFDASGYRSMAADREGSLWLGSDGQGLTQLLPASVKMIGKAHGLPEDVVRPVVEARDGAIWAGVGCSGFVKLRGDEVTVLGPSHLRRFQVTDTCIFSLWPRRDGSIVGAGYSGQIIQIRHDSVTLHPVKRVPLPTALLEDHEGYLWVGTRQSGVHRVEGEQKTFRASDGLPSDDVATLAEDAGGRILVGTGNGVGVISSGHARRLEITNGPMPRKVRALLPDGNRLWVGSYGDGLSVVRAGSVFHFERAQGMPEEIASFLHRDASGFLWWTGNRGIYRAAVQELLDVADGNRDVAAVQTFGTADGMATAETNGGFLPAGWCTRDGDLLLPTIRGLAVIDPKSLAPPAPLPPLRIEEVLLDGKQVEIEDGHVVIPAGTKRVEIRMGAPTFRAPRGVKIWKRLEGFDSWWIETLEQPVSTFTNLPRGRYTFHARASLPGAGGEARETVITLVVQPRFVETWLFRLLLLGCVAGTFLGLYGLRSSALRRRNKLLTELVKKRTRDLETANCQLKRLAETDELTGLGNKRLFLQKLENFWQESLVDAVPISLIMLDVDFFKLYNDTYGHPAGDTCLRRIGGLLAAMVYRASDLPARYGGEEFVVVMPGLNGEHARGVANRIRGAVEALGIPHSASSVTSSVTVSVGYATAHPAAGGTPEELLEAADAALYRAKTAGRNRVSE